MKKNYNEVMDECENNARKYSGDVEVSFDTRLTIWDYHTIKAEYKRLFDEYIGMGVSVAKALRCTYETMRVFNPAQDLDGNCCIEDIMLKTVDMLNWYANGFYDRGDDSCVYNAELCLEVIERFERKGVDFSLYEIPDEQQKELMADIERVKQGPDGYISCWGDEIGVRMRYKPLDRMVGSMDLSTDNENDSDYTDDIIRERLSPEAFALVAEYQRLHKTDIDKVNELILKPLGFEMTPKIKEYIELYSGRRIVYRTACFSFGRRQSCNKLRELFTEIESVNSSIGNNYLCRIGSWMGTSYQNLYIDSEGKIYCEDYARCGNLELLLVADSIEEYIEYQVKEHRLNEEMIKRRIELEEKYFIPELRLTSI